MAIHLYNFCVSLILILLKRNHNLFSHYIFSDKGGSHSKNDITPKLAISDATEAVKAKPKSSDSAEPAKAKLKSSDATDPVKAKPKFSEAPSSEMKDTDKETKDKKKSKEKKQEKKEKKRKKKERKELERKSKKEAKEAKKKQLEAQELLNKENKSSPKDSEPAKISQDSNKLIEVKSTQLESSVKRKRSSSVNSESDTGTPEAKRSVIECKGKNKTLTITKTIRNDEFDKNARIKTISNDLVKPLKSDSNGSMKSSPTHQESPIVEEDTKVSKVSKKNKSKKKVAKIVVSSDDESHGVASSKKIASVVEEEGSEAEAEPEEEEVATEVKLTTEIIEEEEEEDDEEDNDIGVDLKTRGLCYVLGVDIV